MAAVGHVFGYGSLVPAVAEGPRAELPGWRREWGVAMDNAVAIPGYKVYEDPATGERPAVCVAFLDAVAEAGAVLDGVLLPVDAGDLPVLDRRERQYERVAVAEALWLYVGRAESRKRLRRALAAGTAVVQRDYFDLVAGWAPPPPCPVVDLVRRDLPRA